jgi:hypothetical protein
MLNNIITNKNKIAIAPTYIIKKIKEITSILKKKKKLIQLKTKKINESKTYKGLFCCSKKTKNIIT